MDKPDPLKAVQVMMEELEFSRQSRLRAWEALQKIRATLSDLADAIAPLPRKTSDAEGKLLNDNIA